MKKIWSIFLCILSCNTPQIIPNLKPTELHIVSQNLVLPKGDSGAFFLQTDNQWALLYLPGDRAVLLQEFQRVANTSKPLPPMDSEGRMTNWAGIQFTFDSTLVTYQRYAINLVLANFCGGELKIFFIPEKFLHHKKSFSREKLSTKDSPTPQNCPANLTPWIPQEILQQVTKELSQKPSTPLSYSYQMFSDKIEIYLEGEVP